MRIVFFVAMSMMLAMVGHPDDCRAFAGQSAQESDEPANGAIRLKTAVRQQSMITQANAQCRRSANTSPTNSPSAFQVKKNGAASAPA